MRTWLQVWVLIVVIVAAFLFLVGWVIPWLVQHSFIGLAIVIVLLAGAIAYILTGGE